jgi:hypothetical protein
MTGCKVCIIRRGSEDSCSLRSASRLQIDQTLYQIQTSVGTWARQAGIEETSSLLEVPMDHLDMESIYEDEPSEDTVSLP